MIYFQSFVTHCATALHSLGELIIPTKQYNVQNSLMDAQKRPHQGWQRWRTIRVSPSMWSTDQYVFCLEEIGLIVMVKKGWKKKKLNAPWRSILMLEYAENLITSGSLEYLLLCKKMTIQPQKAFKISYNNNYKYVFWQRLPAPIFCIYFGFGIAFCSILYNLFH